MSNHVDWHDTSFEISCLQTLVYAFPVMHNLIYIQNILLSNFVPIKRIRKYQLARLCALKMQ